MVDSLGCTKYNRTLAELQEFLLFSIIVANKTSIVQEKALARFWDFYRLAGGKADLRTNQQKAPGFSRGDECVQRNLII